MSRPKGSTKQVPQYCIHTRQQRGYVRINGTQMYLDGKPKSEESLAHYRRLISEYLAGAMIPVTGKQHDRTIAEVMDWYINHIAQNSPACTDTRSKHAELKLLGIRMMIRRLRPLYGDTLAKDFSPLKLKTFRAQLVNTKRSRPKGTRLYECDKYPGKRLTSIQWSGLAGVPRLSIYSTVRLKVRLNGMMFSQCAQPLEETKTLTTSTINYYVGIVRQMFRVACEHEIVPGETQYALSAVKELKKGEGKARQGRIVRPVSQEHVNAVLAVTSRIVTTMIKLQLVSGMRSGEMCLMRGCDIDRTGKLWLYRPSQHKTSYKGFDRVVRLDATAQELIAPFLNTREPQDYLFSPTETKLEFYNGLKVKAYENILSALQTKTGKTLSVAKSRWTEMGGKFDVNGSPIRLEPKMIISKRYKPRYTTNSYACAIDRACAKTRTPHWHPHQLRHAAGTEFAKKYGIEVARILLGHQHLKVTEVYVESDNAKVDRCLLGDLKSELMPPPSPPEVPQKLRIAG